MIVLKSIEEAKELKVGDKFIFGQYQDENVEFTKVSEDKAISTYILDIMPFGNENDYEWSFARIFCNYLSLKFGLEEGALYIPTEEELEVWFPTNEERIAQYSEELIKRWEDDGSPWYWTQTAASSWYDGVRAVTSSGQFSATVTHTSNIGVRPALKLC